MISIFRMSGWLVLVLMLPALVATRAAAAEFDYAWKVTIGKWNGYCFWQAGWAGGCGIGQVAAGNNAYLLEFYEFRRGKPPIWTITVQTRKGNVVRKGGPLVVLSSGGGRAVLKDGYFVENGFGAVVNRRRDLTVIEGLLSREPASLAVSVPSTNGPTVKASFDPSGYRRARAALRRHVATWKGK